MSYIARRTAHFMIFSTAAVVATACGGSSESDEVIEEPTQSAVTASATGLVSPESFESFLAENPAAQLVNVHVPYQQHIADTDAFIAFDEIVDSPHLPDDQTTPIALYCRSGNMSARAAADLADAGYTNVVDLAGGMNAWADSGRSLLDDSADAN